MAMFGLVGGPLIFASAIAVLFGAYEQDGAHFLFAIPAEIIFEASITIYTIWKGFKPSPILDDTRYTGVGGGSGSAAPAVPSAPARGRLLWASRSDGAGWADDPFRREGITRSFGFAAIGRRRERYAPPPSTARLRCGRRSQGKCRPPHDLLGADAVGEARKVGLVRR